MASCIDSSRRLSNRLKTANNSADNVESGAAATVKTDKKETKKVLPKPQVNAKNEIKPIQTGRPNLKRRESKNLALENSSTHKNLLEYRKSLIQGLNNQGSYHYRNSKLAGTQSTDFRDSRLRRTRTINSHSMNFNYDCCRSTDTNNNPFWFPKSQFLRLSRQSE